MNEFQQEIYKTIDILTEQKLKQLGFDKTKRGRIIAVSNDVAIVQIDGEEYNCKLKRGISVEPNDIVFVKFPQNNDIDKYVETVLGGNEIPENLVISAEEILTKLKTVGGDGSGLDADTLDGKHASEFVTVDDLGDIDISGETIVQNINSTTAIIEDKNLSSNVNDAITKKHIHPHQSTIDSITQDRIDIWNTVSEKANTTDLPTKLSDLNKDINFNEFYYTEDEVDTLLSQKVDNTRVLTDVPSNAKFTDTTYSEITTTEIDVGTSSTLRTITGRRIKYVLDKVSTMISSALSNLTKFDIGLGNIDNTSDLDKPISNATQSALNSKVDKVTGKQLSTEDYTTSEKSKLANIEVGANKYTLPIASSEKLGGIKVGANLSIAEDGTLSVVDSDERTSFITKQEVFVATEGQKLFSLTKGNYQPNTHTLSVYLYGGKQPNIVLNEISSTSFEFVEPLKAGNIVTAEYIELSSASPYPLHGSDHITGGYDPIPIATETNDGLMAKEDKSKLGGIETGANKYIHPSTHPASMIVESTSKRFVNDSEKSTWNKVVDKADITYVDTKIASIVNSAPEALDTLQELANALGNDPNFSTTVLNEIGKKVDKVSGKGLSTEDYTTIEKTKLSGISDNATKNDIDANLKNRANHTGTQTANTISDFANAVRNTVLTGLSTATNTLITTTDSVLSALGKLQKQITDNLTNMHSALSDKVDSSRVLTDVPANAKFTDTITTINGKTGAISKTDIVALGIPAQDTVYTHPSTHPSTMITGLSTIATSGNYSDLSNKPTIPTDTNQLTKTDVYTKTEVNSLLSSTGQGDMMKNIYDTNNNGKVDVAEVAENVDWNNVSGKKVFPTSVTSEASLTIPHGVAPTSPVNGDMWTTTAGLYLRLDGITRTMAHTASWSTVSQAEAEAGTAASQRLWTAQRVRQAILAAPTVHVGENPPTNLNIPWVDTSL